MSDFLSRLVQRTRGEVATVRPVGHAVTAPDPGAAAWDEQVIVREAPLARSPHAPVVREAPAVEDPRAPAAHPPLIQRAAAVPSIPVIAPDASSSSRAAAGAAMEVAAERPSPAGDPHPATPALPVPDDRATTPATVLEASHPMSPARDERRDRPSPAEAAQVGLIAPAPQPIVEIVAPASRPAAAPDRLVPAARPAEPDRRPLPAAMAAPVEVRSTRDPDARPPALPAATAGLVNVAAFPPAAPARLAPANVDPGLVPPATTRAEARRSAAPPPLHRAAVDAGDGDGRVNEHTTTVEVSIGRIEVRLPPRPRATAAGEPLPPARRAAVGLAEYLRDRDAGKPR